MKGFSGEFREKERKKEGRKERKSRVTVYGVVSLKVS
jgi:hypothetical protein